MERIHKIIARSGLGSRREAERWIEEGRVTLNGRTVAALGVTADPLVDEIRVNGRRVSLSPAKIYLMLHKPKGFVTTLKDPQGRPTVADLLKRVKSRVYPAGRLDYDSEGLLILTNDGDVAQKLTHPRFSLPKTYVVKVRGTPGEESCALLRRGVELDGRTVRAARILIRKHLQRNSWVKITVMEGRKRQVRRMFEAIGHPVIALRRIQVGPLKLGDLKKGAYRTLTSVELEELKKL